MMNVAFSSAVEARDECVPRLRKVWEVHRRWKVPLSIFVVGRIIERESEFLKELISDQPDLWDVNSHGYSHTRNTWPRCARPGARGRWATPGPCTAKPTPAICTGPSTMRRTGTRRYAPEHVTYPALPELWKLHPGLPARRTKLYSFWLA
jgi:hypothetical protein